MSAFPDSIRPGAPLSYPVKTTSNHVKTAPKMVDWPRIIRHFGGQFEMSFSGTLRWISQRTSLEVACDLIGIPLSPGIGSHYTDADVALLQALGDVLSTRNYPVPRLMERHRLEYPRKGGDHMGFSLSKEEYLRERAAGKSKNKIAKQQGISGPALFHWLDKWGLKDAAVEQQALRALEMNQPLPEVAQRSEPRLASTARTESTSEQAAGPTQSTKLLRSTESTLSAQLPQSKGTVSTADRPETSITTLPAVQLNLAPVMHVLPHSIDTQALTRDELLHTAVVLFETALAQANQELTDLLGANMAREQLQQYVNHHASTTRAAKRQA